jgi:hypothetical protein
MKSPAPEIIHTRRMHKGSGRVTGDAPEDAAGCVGYVLFEPPRRAAARSGVRMNPTDVDTGSELSP